MSDDAEARKAAQVLHDEQLLGVAGGSFLSDFASVTSLLTSSGTAVASFFDQLASSHATSNTCTSTSSAVPNVAGLLDSGIHAAGVGLEHLGRDIADKT